MGLKNQSPNTYSFSSSGYSSQSLSEFDSNHQQKQLKLQQQQQQHQQQKQKQQLNTNNYIVSNYNTHSCASSTTSSINTSIINHNNTNINNNNNIYANPTAISKLNYYHQHHPIIDATQIRTSTPTNESADCIYTSNNKIINGTSLNRVNNNQKQNFNNNNNNNKMQIYTLDSDIINNNNNNNKQQQSTFTNDVIKCYNKKRNTVQIIKNNNKLKSKSIATTTQQQQESTTIANYLFNIIFKCFNCFQMSNTNKNNTSTNSSDISTNNDSFNLDENNSNFILNDDGDHFPYLNPQQKPMLIKQQQGFNRYGDDMTLYDNCSKHDYNNYYSYLSTSKNHANNNNANTKSLMQNNKNLSTISSTATLSTNLTNANNNRYSQTQFQNSTNNNNNWNISNCFNDSTKTLPSSSPIIPNAQKFKTPINLRTLTHTNNNARTPNTNAVVLDDTPPFTVNNLSNYAYTNYHCYTPDDDNDEEMFNSRRSFNNPSTYTRSYNVRNSTAINNKCILQQSGSAGESSSSISTPSDDLPSDYVNHQNLYYFNNSNTATLSSDISRSGLQTKQKPVWANKTGQYSKYEYLSDQSSNINNQNTNQNSIKYIDDDDNSYSVYSNVKCDLTKLTQNSMNANINRKQQQFNLFNRMSRMAVNQRTQQLPMLTPLYDDYLCDKEVEGYFDNPVYFDCYNTTNKITSYDDINEQKNLIQLLNAISNSSNSNTNSNCNNKRCKGESYC